MRVPVATTVQGMGDSVTLLAEPGRFVAAECMTLLPSMVGTAVRDGQVWHHRSRWPGRRATADVIAQGYPLPTVGVGGLEPQPSGGFRAAV